MMEMLGVLAIIGVLSVGGISGYTKAMMKHNINQSIEQINLISSDIHTKFASQEDYSDLSANTAIIAKIIPSGMVKKEEWTRSSGRGFGGSATYTPGCTGKSSVRNQCITLTKIKNPFSGYVELMPDQNPKTFSIRYDNIPVEACINLATQQWSQDDTFLSITVNENGTKTVQNAQNGSMSISDATQACNADKNTLRLQYK
ncbi:MAG: hypothetical protein ILA52_01285 [Alphaproteobacteria bacterium]|nr:hypothetical protein [Alphaproteobacteria bacterium]